MHTTKKYINSIRPYGTEKHCIKFHSKPYGFQWWCANKARHINGYKIRSVFRYELSSSDYFSEGDSFNRSFILPLHKTLMVLSIERVLYMAFNQRSSDG